MDAPKIILCDFHGVLTNDKLNISHDGTTMFESVCTKDIRAIRELQANGFEFYIVTASDSPIIKAFANKVGCGVIVERDKANLSINEPYIAIGNDVWDLPMLKKAAMAFIPYDSSLESLQDIRLSTNGGNGVIAELIHKIL